MHSNQIKAEAKDTVIVQAGLQEATECVTSIRLTCDVLVARVPCQNPPPVPVAVGEVRLDQRAEVVLAALAGRHGADDLDDGRDDRRVHLLLLFGARVVDHEESSFVSWSVLVQQLQSPWLRAVAVRLVVRRTVAALGPLGPAKKDGR